MVKRVACLAIACCVACSLSIFSFAASPVTDLISYYTYCDLGFPFFGGYILYQGGTQIDRVDPPSSGLTTSSFLTSFRADELTGTNSGNIQVNFVMFPSGVSALFTDTQHFQIPAYELDDSIVNRTATGTVEDWEYIQTGTSGSLHDYDSDISISYRDVLYTTNYNPRYFEIDDNVRVSSRAINPGSYIVSGWFSLNGQYTQAQVEEMVTDAAVQTFKSDDGYERNIEAIIIPHDDMNLSAYYSAGSGYTQVSFSLPFEIRDRLPENGSLAMVIRSNPNSPIPPISSVTMSTSQFVFMEPADSVKGLAGQLQVWFSGLTSTIRSNFSRLIGRADEESEAMGQAYDQNLDTTTQQGVTQESQVHVFEQQYQGNLQQQAESIDLTVPSNYGGAISFIGGIFVRTFNNMGSYNAVIMVPLILGMVLHLLGRGQAALGRQLNLQGSEARYQRHQVERRQAAINARNYSSKYGG